MLNLIIKLFRNTWLYNFSSRQVCQISFKRRFIDDLQSARFVFSVKRRTLRHPQLPIPRFLFCFNHGILRVGRSKYNKNVIDGIPL